jgi:hypothetical protein
MNNVVTQHLSVQSILQEWGKGRAIGKAPNGYPSQSAHDRMRRIPGRGTVAACGLDEDAFDLVDQIVSELKTKGDCRHPTLALYYVEGWNLKRVGAAVRDHQGKPIGKHKARDALIAGESWVAGKLDDKGVVFVR